MGSVATGWRKFVEVAGRQTYYLVGPSPWMVRDIGRESDRPGGSGGPPVDDRPATPGSPPPSWTIPVEMNRRGRQVRARTLVGTR